MKPENQVGIVYEDLTKREKIKYIKSIHKKLKNHIDLDVHEINFIFSSIDTQGGRHLKISEYLYHYRDVNFTTILEDNASFGFYHPRMFRILYTDSSMWETITTVVNKYVTIKEDRCTNYCLTNKYGSRLYAYYTDIHMPREVWSKLLYKTNEIYNRETKKFRDEERKVLNNIKINTNNEDENDSDLVM